MLRKAVVGTSFNKEQRIVFFNLVNLNTHLKKFSSKRDWKLMKKLDSFCKTWEGKISAYL